MDEDAMRRHRLEDVSTTVQSLLQDVERTMQRACLKGGISGDQRRDVRFKLEDAARHVDRLPAAPRAR